VEIDHRDVLEGGLVGGVQRDEWRRRGSIWVVISRIAIGQRKAPALSDGAIQSSTNLDVHPWPAFPFYFNIGSWTAVALLDDDLITIAPLTADRHVVSNCATRSTRRLDYHARNPLRLSSLC
jgi:hypothetical protein